MMKMLKEKIDKIVLRKAKERKEEHGEYKDDVFFPSEAGKCIRNLFYEKKLQPEKPAYIYRLFLTGDLIHEWIQKSVYNEDKSEVEIEWNEGDIKFSGRMDVLLKDRIIEFKSIKNFAYVEKKPSSQHVEQINMYMKATGIHKGTIVYIQKDNFDVLEHDVEFDKKLYNKTISRFKKLNKALIENHPPTRLKCFGKDYCWECNYCPFKETCTEGNP